MNAGGAGRPDYHDFMANFDPDSLVRELAGDMTALNACVECCDRHAGSGRVAVNYEGADGTSRAITFEELRDRSAQVASLLAKHGVGPGDRVSGLLPRIPELVALVLGVWRAGAVYQPLFTAFGPKAIDHRLKTSGAKVVVTDPENRPKLDEVEERPVIMTIGGHGGDVDFNAAADAEPARFEPVMRKGSDGMLLMATSGTTGLPKGVKVPLSALPAFAAYMKFGLELLPDDVFWNIADPGWAYGLYYAVTGPLLLGHQTTLHDGPFSVDSTVRIVKKLGVTNFTGAPTAYRMIAAGGGEALATMKGQIRVASSAGEPLNPELMRWWEANVGSHLFDQYGQTECAMVLMNHHGLGHDVHPGAAGLPMPGFALAVVDDEGRPVEKGRHGILAVDLKRSPYMFFEGYLGREGQDWVGDYYLTGDTVEENQDGTISFVGRSDDVITSAGYRIGPFDVESALLEHPAVAESAVVGKPDPERGEIVKAFVILTAGHDGTDALAEELRQHVRQRLGKHAYPREVAFPDSLPKTPSGKIQRFLLRKE
ncbi:MAG: AMP-binding protein [Rhizobiales bacterium NRL2]|jgi:acetyl-CoA synthetase|nr:MAG: AMP-binding protein [Rhizobiales bacterium NRL2]